jgi:hypothetical protein
MSKAYVSILTRVVLELAEKQNFWSLARLGHILQASQKLEIGPKWDYGKIRIKMPKFFVSKPNWR